MLFQKIVTISGKTYRELKETNLRGPRKHCAQTSIKKRIEGPSFLHRKRCLDAHFVHPCHRNEILMSSIFSFRANTLIANENTNLHLFFFSISVHPYKGPRDNAVQTTTYGKGKVFIVPNQFFHKSSLLLSFYLFNLSQSHLCSFLVQLLIFLLLFCSAIFLSLFLFLKFTSLCFVFPESFL